MSNENNTKNVNMKNLYLGASTTESMFNSFQTRLDKLASKVETLEGDNARKENQGEAMKRYGIVMDKIHGLEERLGLVEQALLVQHPDGHIQPFSQVGNTITTILKDIKDATGEIKLKANIVHLNTVEATFEKSLKKLEETIARERASSHAVRSLEQGYQDMNTQLVALQTLLSTKVDKASVQSMTATLDRLNGFSSFRTKSLDRLIKLESELDNTSYALNQQVSITSSLAKQVAGNKHEIDVRPTNQEMQTSLRIIREELDSCETKLRIDYTNTISELNKTLRKELSIEQMKLKRFTTSNIARITSAEKMIPTLATKIEVKEKVNERFFNTFQEEVKENFRKTASYKEINLIRKRTMALESHFQRLAKHTEVMHRFIKWYSDNGATYDHNNALIEKQLVNLSIKSQAQRQQPYDRPSAAFGNHAP